MANYHPDLKFEVAFTTNPLDAAPVWTDLTTRIRAVDGFDVRRGRTEDLGRFEAGSLAITLDNSDRALEPFYATGLYNPNVVPRRRCRLTAGAGTYPIFDGLIDDWQPVYPQGRDGVVVVTATDLLGYLAGVQLQVPYVREVLLDAPSAYYRMSELTGSTIAVDSSGAGRTASWTGTPTFGVSDPITDDVDGAVTLSGTQVAISPATTAVAAGTVEIWAKRPTAPGTLETIMAGMRNSDGDHGWTLNILSSGAFSLSGSGGTLDSATGLGDNAWHHIVYAWGAATKLYIDGALADSSPTVVPAHDNDITFVGSQNNLASAFNGSVDEVAVYSTELSATRVSAHYTARNGGLNDATSTRVTSILGYAGIPSALYDVETGASPMTGAGNMGSQKALEALRDAEVTEAGVLFVSRAGKVTFRNRYRPQVTSTTSGTSQATLGGSGVGDANYLPDPIFAASAYGVANVVTNSRRNGTTSVAKDSSSVTKYGERGKSLSTQSTSDTEATARAQWELAHLKDPGSLRFRTLDFIIDNTSAVKLLALELHDRVTVQWSPPGGGSAISQEALITAIRHRYTNGVWTQTLEVSPTETQAYWILGVVGHSELGTTTRLGF